MLTRPLIPVAAIAMLPVLSAAAPAPDVLLGRLVADARAVAPASIAFERLVRATTQDKSGQATTQVRVDRWDGRAFTLVSVNGKPPAASEIDAFRKVAASRPVPGYHRIADLLAASAVRQTDAQGRTLYRVTGLPKGTVDVGRDVSSNLVAEFTVDTSAARPYVTQMRFVLPKPLSFFMVARLDSLEAVYDYRLDGMGRPYLARTVQTISGAQFGQQGSTRTEALYTMLR